MKKKIYIYLVILLPIIIGVTYYLRYSPVKKSITVEAGQYELNIKDFLKNDVDAKFITEITEEDISKVGEISVKIKVNSKEYESQLIVQDTTAPTATISLQTIYLTQTIDANQFIENIKDVSAVTVKYKNEPDFSQVSTQDITIVLTDESDNKSELTTQLTILKDETPPTITGVKDLKVYVGDSISYKKNVTVTDNVDEDVKLKVDTSQVNIKKAGTYKVTYSSI